MCESYCVSCKSKTISNNPKIVKAKNGRLMEKSNCSICGKNKSKFIKSKKVGALARRKGPCAVEKAAYIMSNFVTPAPSFTALGKVLAGQAFKGIKDNVDYYKKGKGVDIHKAILKNSTREGLCHARSSVYRTWESFRGTG